MSSLIPEERKPYWPSYTTRDKVSVIAHVIAGFWLRWFVIGMIYTIMAIVSVAAWTFLNAGCGAIVALTFLALVVWFYTQ